MATSSRTVTTFILRQLIKMIKVLPLPLRVIVILVSIGIVVAIALLLPAGSLDNTVQPNPTVTPAPHGFHSVIKVIDGDTIAVLVENQTKTVRLIGIDTPEVVDPRQPVQCFGQEASAKLKQMIGNQAVRLESDSTQNNTDKYGRWLRYAFLPDGTHLNLQLVVQGYAFEYTYRTPYQYQSEFKAAQQTAREQSLGLWNSSNCPQ